MFTAADRLGLRALIAAATLVIAVCSMAGCERGMRGAQGETPATAVEPAQDSSATVSPSSPGITAEEDAGIVPGPPGTVLVSHRPGVHVIEWQGTRDDKITGYRVLRRCPSGDWVEAGFVGLRADDDRNRGTYRFEDRFPQDCDYTVAAVGTNGVTGPKSVEIQ